MSATFTNKILSFKANQNGIDYVLGDIHGRFDLVKKSLQQVNFNHKTDRLFCVGDLIDRGPYSHNVIDFLKKPYVYAIRGNHEDMLLEFYEQYPNATDETFFYFGEQNGMTWFLEQSLEQRTIILEELKKLPLVIEVESERGLIGLVHADIPQNMSWQDFKTAILDDNSKVIETALWGRSRLNYNIEQDIEGLGRLYVGHTVQNNIKKLANVVALDTGAVFDRHLSMVNMTCSTQVLLNNKEPNNHILNIVDNNNQTPFRKANKS